MALRLPAIWRRHRRKYRSIDRAVPPTGVESLSALVVFLAATHFPFGPRGSTVSGKHIALLDHFVGPLEERRRDRQAEGLGGLEVDRHVVAVGLFDR